MATSIDATIDDERQRDAASQISRQRIAREPLDTAIRLVTPERIRFQYPLAGPFRRAAAYLLDLLIWVAILIVFIILLNILSVFNINDGQGFTTGVLLVVYFILQWGYGAFCEAVFN